LKKKEDEVKSESNTPLLPEKEKVVKPEEEAKDTTNLPSPPPGLSKGTKEEAPKEKKFTGDKKNNNV